jgi:hypothetical protein
MEIKNGYSDCVLAGLIYISCRRLADTEASYMLGLGERHIRDLDFHNNLHYFVGKHQETLSMLRQPTPRFHVRFQTHHKTHLVQAFSNVVRMW